MSNQITCMVADGFSHYKLRGRLGQWFWRVFAIRQIFNEGYLAGWKAALIVEGQKPPTNSDYAAALRVFEEYAAAKDKRGDSVVDFPIWLGQRLNADKPHSA